MAANEPETHSIYPVFPDIIGRGQGPLLRGCACDSNDRIAYRMRSTTNFARKTYVRVGQFNLTALSSY